jgi:hypothetical protein
MISIGVAKILRSFSEFSMGYWASGPEESYASYQATVLLIRLADSFLGCLKIVVPGPKIHLVLRNCNVVNFVVLSTT